MSAERSGKYTYCFSNEMSSYSRKVLRRVARLLAQRFACTVLTPYSFNVHGVLYVADDEQTAPVEQEIRSLSSALQLVKDEQAYLVVRERVHRNSQSGCSGSSDRDCWDVIADSG